MDILHVCNKEMLRTHRLEAILSKTCSANIIDPIGKDTTSYSNIFHDIVNNIVLLLDNIKRIMVFK